VQEPEERDKREALLKVYIAGPYTKPEPILNVRRVLEVADELLEAGHVPFVPHLYHFWHFLSPKPYQTWMDLDFAWLESCDAMIHLPGESSGADAEEAMAAGLEIPIFESVEEFLAWEGLDLDPGLR